MTGVSRASARKVRIKSLPLPSGSIKSRMISVGHARAASARA
jgi:hypothetical protein